MRVSRLLLSIAIAIALVSPAAAQNDVTKLRVVLKMEGTERVLIRRNLPFPVRAGKPKRFDLYLPPASNAQSRFPLVVFVNGIDPAQLKDMPELKDWGQYQDWPRLAAASGMAAVTHTSGENPATVFEDLIAHLRKSSSELSIDPARIAIWACSANGRVGVPYAMGPGGGELKAAVFYYAVMEAPSLRTDLPLLVARAGRDNASLNAAIDNFVARALAANSPLRLINYPQGDHGFDVKNDTAQSRRIISETLDFFKDRLGVTGKSR